MSKIRIEPRFSLLWPASKMRLKPLCGVLGTRTAPPPPTHTIPFNEPYFDSVIKMAMSSEGRFLEEIYSP